MAAHTVYVDGTDSVPTHFTSLQNAITYMVANYNVLGTNNGSGAAGPLNIEISLTTADPAAQVNGWTTSAANYVNIYTTDAARNKSAAYSESHYRIEAANVFPLKITDEHVRVTGVQVKQTGANANAQGAIEIGGIADSVIHLSQCFVETEHSGTYRSIGISISDAQATVYIWNCIVNQLGVASNSISNAIYAVTCTAVYVYNCTLLGTYAGLRRDAGTVVAKNTYAHGSTYGFYGDITKTNCASSDATADGTSPLTGVLYSETADSTHAGFTEIDAATANLAIKVGSPLIGAGATIADGAPLDYTTDIAGTTRS